MMQVVPKWKVDVEFSLSEDNMTFWINEFNLANVLTKLSGMSFADERYFGPVRIIVTYCPPQQTATVTSSTTITTGQ